MTVLYTVSHVYLVCMDDNSVFTAHSTESGANEQVDKLQKDYPQEAFRIEKVRVKL